jgi:DNA-binding NtrC family response regulator
MNRVLVVDDEAAMRAALEAHFLRREWQVDTAGNAAEAMEKFRRTRHPLVVTDVRMPGADGFHLMQEARALSPHTAVILLTAFASIPQAVTAMKGGACDYLVKPVAFEQLEQAAERVLVEAQTQSHAIVDVSKHGSAGNDAAAHASAGNAPREPALVGHAPAWLRALERARQAAASGADVLIEAESGTGKELVARLIHRLSARRDHAFVAVNCSAFPETLLESELFGYARGAFTGALTAKPGRFEQAHRGTLLLDEVGEMPLGLQPKLLRVLQEREFDRLGDMRSVRVDVRVISTTNRTLSEMVREGKFRADLFYRLNVIPLTLPPLRDRFEDIRELAEHFLRLYAAAGKNLRLTAESVGRLESHHWPGNVRELANCMRRSVALATGPDIGVEGFEQDQSSSLSLNQSQNQGKSQSPRPAAQNAAKAGQPRDRCESGLMNNGAQNDAKQNDAKQNEGNQADCLRPGISLEAMERRLVEMTLEATGGNRSRAAELLGVSLRTVRNKIRSYGLPGWTSYLHE